jgi:hypothetical protein
MASYLSKDARWSHFEIEDWMPGPWKVATLGNSWYIVNVKTKASNRIGRIGGPRGNLSGINYRERATAEARSRNELVENQKNYPWLFRKGGKAGVMKELEQVLYTDRIGGKPGHEAIEAAYLRCNLAGCTTKDLNNVLQRVDERWKAGERFPGGGKKRHGVGAKKKWKTCPECEANWSLGEGEPFPPHRAFRGVGLCPGSGTGGTRAQNSGGGKKRHAPKRGVKWKHFPEGYTAVLHDYKGNMLDAMTYHGWHKKPPLKQRKITEALLLATDIKKLLK